MRICRIKTCDLEFRYIKQRGDMVGDVEINLSSNSFLELIKEEEED